MKERMLCGVMYNSLDEELTKESLVSSLEFLPQVNSIMNDITKKVSLEFYLYKGKKK